VPRAWHGKEANTATLTVPQGWYDDRADFVYVTTDLDLAWAMAERAPGRGRPKVLVVEPMGPLEDDPATFDGGDADSYRCREPARVLRVLTAGRGGSGSGPDEDVTDAGAPA
jgi:hypothetical protein